MISRPAFKAHLRAVSIPGEGAVLLSERDTFILRGAVYEQIAPLIDGRRSADDVVAALAGTVDSATVWYALLRLETAGHIMEHNPAARQPEAFWPALGADPAAADVALATASARVFTAGACGSNWAGAFAAALARFGIGASVAGCIDSATPPGPGSDLDVVLTDDYLCEPLRRFDEQARSNGQRWLLVRPAGLELWIGPQFRPDRPGCLVCLRHRLEQRRPVYGLAARHDPAEGARVPLAAAKVTAEAGCLLAATEVAKALAGIAPSLDGLLWSLDLQDRSSGIHRLVPNPACPRCGSETQTQPQPVCLKPQRVAFDSEGGLRTVAPEAMLETHGHLVSPILGVVGSLTRAPGTEGVGQHYLADDLLGGCADTLAQLRQRFRSGSAGKGIGHAQARASALGEALERYSTQFRGTELRIPGTFRELGEDAIHPNRVANYSERQYRERDAWNAHADAKHRVPEPFDPKARIDWTPIWSLTEKRHKLLPTELLYFGPGWGAGQPRQPRFCPGDTNGCASGNVLEEAVLQGFLELVERDAVAMWWYNRVRRPAVDLASFDDPWLAAIGQSYRALDREVVALDLTHDLGIPVFAGLCWRRGERESILIGFGCHLNPRIALQRALTEMCQMLSVDVAGDAGVIKALGDGWLDWATRANQPYLVPNEHAPKRTRDDFPSIDCSDLLDCIEFCRERVEGQGLELLALDQTRDDVGMPVARVVVPGLRHFWARFGPGRLYEVPVGQGWLPAPVPEDKLNPIPFFW